MAATVEYRDLLVEAVGVDGFGESLSHSLLVIS